MLNNGDNTMEMRLQTTGLKTTGLQTPDIDWRNRLETPGRQTGRLGDWETESL